jgi:hypothetical protein
MNISYQKVIDWFKGNIKTLIIFEVICLLISTIYFLTAPRIYEANFSIGLPKVPAAASSNPNAVKMRLMISPQEFIRPTQDPMGYPEEFIKNCMGEDTNANRKRFINALQLGVKQQGDVIAFTLRLEGNERSASCAKLLLTKVLNNLSVTQENYLKSAGLSQDNDLNIAKPSLIQDIRMSDSYVKPDFIKLFTTALLAGFFLTLFYSVMIRRYRA